MTEMKRSLNETSMVPGAALDVRQEEGAAAVPVQHVAAAHLRVGDDRGRRRHDVVTAAAAARIVVGALHPRKC